MTFEKITTPEEIRAILEKAPGVIVLDKPEENVCQPLQATGHDEVYVGRIRRDISQPNSFHAVWAIISVSAAKQRHQIAGILKRTDYVSNEIPSDSIVNNNWSQSPCGYT